MKVKQFIPYLLPLALTVSWAAQAGTDYIDTFTLNAVDSGSVNSYPASFIEGLTGSVKYDVNTSVLDAASFTQIDNANNGAIYTYDLSNHNASQITFVASQDGFSLNANYDTAGDVNPGFGVLTIAVNQPVNGPLTVGQSYALQSGSIYDYNGVSYALSGSLTLSAQQVITGIPNVPVVPEPEEWAMLLLGLPLISWVVRRKQAAAGMMAMPA